MPTWLRNPAGVLLLVVLLLGMVSTATLAADIGRPFGGYVSVNLFQPTGAIIGAETPIWWPIYRTRLVPNNEIDLVRANGRPYRPDARSVFREAWAANENSVNLHVYSIDDRLWFDVQAPVLRFDFIHFLELKLPEMIVGLCFWLLAIVVLKAQPGEPLNQIFAIAAALVAAHRWLAFSSIWMDERFLPTLLTALFLTAAGIIGATLIHFALLFPTPANPWPRRLIVLAYTAGATCGLTMAVMRVPAFSHLLKPSHTIIGTSAYFGMLVVYLSGVVVLSGRVAALWFTGQHSRRERRTGLIILLGLVMAIPILLTLAGPIMPGMGEGQSHFWNGLDLRYLLLAIPLTLAFVIVRYQSMKSPSRLLMLVFVLAGSALVAAIFSWLWGLAQDNWPASGEHPPFPYLFAGIFLASAFWSTQAGWRGWFGRLLQWDTQSYEAVRRFGRRASGTTDLTALTIAIAGALTDELHLVRAAVWLWQPATAVFELSAEAGETSSPLPARLPLGEDSRLEAGQPLRLDLPDEAPRWLQPARQPRTIDVLVPLINDGRPVGLLGLGHRWDEEVFDDRDLVIAELIGQQATLFLLAAMQIEELRRVPERILAAQESERRRLAAELHDTVQQFLGGLPFALDFTVEQVRADPQGIVDALERCLKEAEAMAESARRIRFNLAPSQLEVGLARSLNQLVTHVTRRGKLQTSLMVADGLDEATTLATREALYRVIQQALDNVVAHAQATEVSVRLDRVDSRVNFFVVDNGRGSTEAEQRSASERGRYGLSSMRDRLALCGGEFTFISVPGRGTTVSGWVPAGGAPQTK